MFRTAGLALTVLFLSAGCLGAISDEIQDPADISVVSENTTSDEPPALNRTVETLDLTWSEVRVVPPLAPTGLHRVVGENCVVFDVEGPTLVEEGVVTVNWTSPDIETTPYILLRVQTSDLGERVEHRLGPTHKEVPYEVDISGWYLTTDLPMDLIIGLIAPTHFYASTEHEATVTVEMTHTGTMIGPDRADCG